MESRNITKQDLLLAIGVVGSLLTVGVLAVTGKKDLAIVLSGAILIIFIYSLFKISWNEIGENESKRRQNLRSKKNGKIRYALTKLIDYFSILAVILFGLMFVGVIALKVFGNGS